MSSHAPLCRRDTIRSGPIVLTGRRLTEHAVPNDDRSLLPYTPGAHLAAGNDVSVVDMVTTLAICFTAYRPPGEGRCSQ